MLEKDFNHIVGYLTGLWGYPELDEYLDNILTTERSGNRQGFPLDVFMDLSFLQKLHIDVYNHKTYDSWEMNFLQ